MSGTISDDVSPNGFLEIGEAFDFGGVTYIVDEIGTGGSSGGFLAHDINTITSYFFYTDNTLGNNSAITTTASGTYALCFLPGTLFTTARGEVAIEDLKIGDLLLTTEGKTVPVRWISKQTVATMFAPRATTNPIRISAGALGDGLPRRDLYISPNHGVMLDGRIVHASALVNGTTIVQVESMPARFEYLNIETEAHQGIFAEGAAVETFVDITPRVVFDNWAEYQATYPDWQPIPEMDLPRVTARRLLPADTRERLAAAVAEIKGTDEQAA
ncbi:MAG: Hint domain-containing protein [Hyphomicrobiaceae bacterium]